MNDRIIIFAIKIFVMNEALRGYNVILLFLIVRRLFLALCDVSLQQYCHITLFNFKLWNYLSRKQIQSLIIQREKLQ